MSNPTYQPPQQPQQQPVWGQTPQPPLPPQPSKVKRILLGCGIAFGSWLIGFTMGSLGDTATTTAEPAPTVTVVETETAAAPPAEATTEAPKPKTPAPAPKPQIDTTIDNGTHEVGVDVQAGQYKTMVPDGDLCYWARSKDDSGDSIIVNELVNGPARQSVTIKRGEFFESNDCGTWHKVG